MPPYLAAAGFLNRLAMRLAMLGLLDVPKNMVNAKLITVLATTSQGFISAGTASTNESAVDNAARNVKTRKGVIMGAGSAIG